VALSSKNVHGDNPEWRLVQVNLKELKVVQEETLECRNDAPLEAISAEVGLSQLLQAPPAEKIRNLEGSRKVEQSARTILDHIGSHTPEPFGDMEPVFLLEEGSRIVTGTHDGSVRIWDLNAAEDLTFRSEDIEAREALRQARKIEAKVSLHERIRRTADLFVHLDSQRDSLEDRFSQATLHTWEYMNNGLNKIAFRFSGVNRIQLFDRADKRVIAVWISSMPLLTPDYDNVVATPSFFVRAAQARDGLAVETSSGTAILVQLFQGDHAVPLNIIDSELSP